MLPDHYKVLGIDENADTNTIKKSYRKLVLTCHPDRVTDSEQRAEKQKQFHDVQRAYELLIDDEKRARYEAELKLEQLRKERGRTLAGQELAPPLPRYDFLNYDTRGNTFKPSLSPLSDEGDKTSRQRPRRPKDFAQSSTEGARDPRRHHVTHSSGDDDEETHTNRTRPVRRTAYYSTQRLHQARIRPSAVASSLHHQASIRDNYRNAQPSQLGGLKCVSGYIGRHEVTALSDTGAAENCIRKQYVMDLKLHVRQLKVVEPQSFVMGHGKLIQVIGAVDCNWKFAADSVCVDTVLYVIPDSNFDIILGADFLFKTKTITEKRYRLSPMRRPHDSLHIQLVNLCGTPVRCLRGTLGWTECSALPDSGSEPNLIAYDYAEAQGWLLDMYQGPESCRLLQFADGSTETVSGRLRMRWNFLTGWGPATSDGRFDYDFEVLRGCPFDVILGCAFLDETEAFTRHKDSMCETVKDGPSGLNVVVWVEAKIGKTKKPVSVEAQEREKRKRERDAEFEKQAKAQWPSATNRWCRTDEIVGAPSTSARSRSATARTLRRTPGDVGDLDPKLQSASATEQTLQEARQLLRRMDGLSSMSPSLSSPSTTSTKGQNRA